ncbi:MAG: PrsW family intramembrane metalloprotease [Chloroflexi bacterium]|nr:PrsW family intramembrane metalloprotease [Chloroflexota bacterium]
MQPRSTIHWPSIGQLALGVMAALILFGLAALLTGSALAGWLGSTLPAQDTSTVLTQAAGVALMGLLVLPSLVFAFLRLAGRQVLSSGRAAPGWLLPTLLFIAWAAVVGLSTWVAAQKGASEWILPVLYPLAVGLPVGLYLAIGRRGLPVGSPQRDWGLFDLGLLGSSALVLVVELLVMVLLVIIGLIVVASQPQLSEELTALGQRLMNAQLNPELTGRILAPYLKQPWVIFLGLAVFSGIVPLIEELLKTLPVWLLAGRGLSPAQGFAAGLLSGAGFALFESLGTLTGVSDGSWTSLVIGRAGTDLVHMVNTGLMGWALASAWQQRRYLRLGLTYLAVVLIHGTWNVISLVMGTLPVVGQLPSPSLQFLQQAWVAPAALGVLFAVLFVVLLVFNHLLRREAATANPENLPAEPEQARPEESNT